MLTTRKAEDRGYADHGWLKTFHTFSFADYHDERFVHYGPLRVINDDTVAGGAGFPRHGHRDMEIITYVLDGAVAHKDSMGTSSVIPAGEVQRMRAGTGVLHSEFNASQTDPLRLLQIWIVPQQRALQPDYAQRHFSDEEKRGKLRLIVSPDGADGSLSIAQDVRLYATILQGADRVSHRFDAGRKGWLQVARGEAVVNGVAVKTGDGVALDGEPQVELSSSSSTEILLFDLPA
jgi:quercetin 2,3-dioxygenase